MGAQNVNPFVYEKIFEWSKEVRMLSTNESTCLELLQILDIIYNA